MENLRREGNFPASKDSLQIRSKGELPVYAQVIPSISKQLSVFIFRIKQFYRIWTGTIEHHILDSLNLPVKHGPWNNGVQILYALNSSLI